MKIKRPDEEKTICLGDLHYGDVFEYQKNIYMKVFIYKDNKDGNKDDIVNVETGEIKEESIFVFVFPLKNATMTY